MGVGNGVDFFDRSVGGLTGGCGDVYGAVFFDGHLGAGFFGDLVDGFTLRADDLTDLRYWHFHRGDAGRELAHFVGDVDDFSHGVENGEPGIPGLR